MNALEYTLESHDRSATLYLRGELSAAGAVHALNLCADLPSTVRALRVDCRGIGLFHPSAIDAFASMLGDWREGRGGMTHVELPRERRFGLERAD